MKKFIILIFTVLVSLLSNAQTYRFVDIRYFDEYGDLCKKAEITTLITISDQTYQIDTKGIKKTTLYRCNYFNDDFPLNSQTYTRNGVTFKEGSELCIDILPSKFDELSKSQRENHIFTVVITDLYSGSSYLSSMIDVRSEGTKRTIRYTTDY